jgi:hypothetical protein
MELWSATETEERDVEKWQTGVLDTGWPVVTAALIASVECENDQDEKTFVIGLAAADIVGVSLGLGKPDGWSDSGIPVKVLEWIRSHPRKIETAILENAIQAVSRAEEYFEFWGEDEESTYPEATKALRQALGDRSDDHDDELDSKEY